MTKKEKYWKITKYTFSQAIIAWLIWEGVFNENMGAGRLLTTFYWILALLLIIGASAMEGKEKSSLLRKLVIPQKIQYAVSLSYMAIFVWNGWWMTFIAALLIWISICSIYDKK